MLSEKKYKESKIRINNAHVKVAGGITHELYDMVDAKELHSISIEDVRKSKHSVEVLFGVIIGFGASYIAGKIVDIPYNLTIEKIHRMLKKWKRKTPQSTLDIFFDDEKIK